MPPTSAVPRALAALALLTAACVPVSVAARTPAPSPAPAVTAFLHATVVPMDAERVLRDHTVIVADGEIVAVGPSSEVEVPAGAERIDAAGRYLLPALCDMHVHLLGESWNAMLPPEDRLASADVPFERFLFPYLANGVTTVQVLSAAPEHVALRRRIESGELLGPRMILARMIDGPDKAWPPPLSTWVASPEEAREAVRQAKEAGYDMMKVYSFLDPASYDAIVETAGELGMDVIGHIPMSLSLDYVLEAGQKLIAHSEEVDKHAGDAGPEGIEELAETMAAHGVWMIPTLVTTESILEIFADAEGLLARPEAAYFTHPMQRGLWSFLVERLYLPIPEAARRRIADGLAFQRPLTLALQAKGGKLLAGSDTPLPGLVPGFALHRELEALVAVGLTPYEALRTATAAPFEYLGEADTAGTIEVGRRTDLLLVEADPLEDIAAASRVAGVLVQGRWLGAEEIRRTMAELAAAP